MYAISKKILTQRLTQNATPLATFSDKKHPRSNVMYTELISDPVLTVKKLYAEVGYDFTPEYEGRLKTYIEENNKEREKLKKKGGKKLHSYDVKDFGLKEEAIEEQFEWYKKKFFTTK
jgi:hypothetical protein